MMEKFTFFPSYWDAIKDLPKEMRQECLEAIVSYGVTGELPDVEGFAATVFKLVKPNIDASAKKREAGRNGGASEAEADEKQNGSKTEAKSKQNVSRTEAERKQTASDKEKEKDKDKDKGVWNKELEEGELERELESLPEGVRRTTREWLAYKRERREGYKPTGMKALIRKIRDETRMAGEEKVIAVIESSMSSGYQGIVWDRLERAAPRRTRGDEQNDVLIAMMEGRA